jgi:hypothetical protein
MYNSAVTFMATEMAPQDRNTLGGKTMFNLNIHGRRLRQLPQGNICTYWTRP